MTPMERIKAAVATANYAKDGDPDYFADMVIKAMIRVLENSGLRAAP